MVSHKTKENDFRNVKFNTFYITDDSDHLSALDEPPDKWSQSSVWDEPTESVFKTITPNKTTTPFNPVTPIKTAYDDMESDFDTAVASEFTSPVPLDFKTSSPINPKYVDKESDFEPPIPIKTAGVIETQLTPEQKTIEDEKNKSAKRDENQKLHPKKQIKRN